MVYVKMCRKIKYIYKIKTKQLKLVNQILMY